MNEGGERQESEQSERGRDKEDCEEEEKRTKIKKERTKIKKEVVGGCKIVKGMQDTTERDTLGGRESNRLKKEVSNKIK